MGTYPWGPHGPQVGPNQVTPNPTPAYVPPPSYNAPSWPTPSYGGGAVGSGAPMVYTGPRRKGYFVALLLTLLFGPLGLFYASKKGALLVLLFLIGFPVTLSFLGAIPGGSPMHPFAILDHDSIMNPMWSLCVMISMGWAVFAVAKHNRALKKAGA